MKILLILTLVLFCQLSFAQGLMIHATEIGVAKFHRYDNKLHPYSPDNVWAHHIMPDAAGKETPIVFVNPDNSVTIQFSSLEQLLQTAMQIAQAKQTKISVLNINGHGLPGGMWYPKDENQRKSFECISWRKAANAPDKSNYDEYYSPVSKDEVLDLRKSSAQARHYACTTGVPEWQEVVARNPGVTEMFTDDAQIHFESCIVGLGPAGEAFTTAVGALLLKGSKVMVKTSTYFGLGDWSMPEGMGFWDYFTDDQLEQDNKIYSANKRDRDIMKKGVIRVATPVNGKWTSNLVADQDFMLVGFEKPGFSNRGRVIKDIHSPMLETIMSPISIHLPGTAEHLQRMN